MTIEDPKDEGLAERSANYEKLVEFLDAEEFQEYASGEGPLLISQLARDTRMSDVFRECVSEYDWPSLDDGNAMRPIHQFDSDADFWDAYSNGNNPHFLNNFRAWATTQPSTSTTTGIGGYNIYGLYPAIHRGRVVAPEFFDHLKDVYEQLDERYNFSKLNEVRPAVIEERPDFVRALHAAYRVYGRLVKPDDFKRTSERMFGRVSDDTDTSLIITDVNKYLYT